MTGGRWREALSHYTRGWVVGTSAEGIATVESGAGTRSLGRSQRLSEAAQRMHRQPWVAGAALLFLLAM